MEDEECVAELVGIMLGDGSLGCYKSGNKVQYHMKISLDSEKDKEYVKYVVSLVHRAIGIKPLVRFRNGENTVDIRAFGKEMIKKFDGIGLERSPKWGKAKIPSPFLNCVLSPFVLKGYFDTDGALVIAKNNGTIYPRLEMKVCPAPMQKQFIDILDMLKFRFGVYDIGKGKVRIQANGISQLIKWLEYVGFSNPKNQKKADYILNLYKAKKNEKRK